MNNATRRKLRLRGLKAHIDARRRYQKRHGGPVFLRKPKWFTSEGTNTWPQRFPDF